MTRLIAVLLVAGLAALAAIWLADHDGTVLIAIAGYEIRMRAVVAAALLLLAFGALYAFIRLILRGPAKLSAFLNARRARTAYHALSRGLIAAAAGETAEAEHISHQLEKLVGAQPLSLLLKAEAARIAGDQMREEAAYDAMLAHSETAFLGLRNLARLALARGSKDQALDYALRAYALKSKSSSAAEVLFDVRVARGEWAEARALLDSAVQAKLFSAETAQRRAALIQGPPDAIADLDRPQELAG
jgi:HemY protein